MPCAQSRAHIRHFPEVCAKVGRPLLLAPQLLQNGVGARGPSSGPRVVRGLVPRLLGLQILDVCSNPAPPSPGLVGAVQLAARHALDEGHHPGQLLAGTDREAPLDLEPDVEEHALRVADHSPLDQRGRELVCKAFKGLGAQRAQRRGQRVLGPERGLRQATSRLPGLSDLQLLGLEASGSAQGRLRLGMAAQREQRLALAEQHLAVPGFQIQGLLTARQSPLGLGRDILRRSR
mmetsp:Transcript_139432/g.445990  ORF Transcript_139432/g.445990 Transcript_139432/m.445990 type:complete len:234 (+) Transcript_139432:498-1199(+)